jgi:hypothetical protein
VACFAGCPPPWIGSISSVERLAPGTTPVVIMPKATTIDKYKRLIVNLIEFFPSSDEEVCAITLRPHEKTSVFTIIESSAEGE